MTVTGAEASDDFHDVHFEMEYSGHNISATDRVWVTVVGIVWMPLGQATSLSRFTVGRVYVPTMYGGQLLISGSSSSLYYMGALSTPDKYGVAIAIVKGQATATETGNPCTRSVPAGEFRCYYVWTDAPASLTAQFSQQRTDLPVPWSCTYYPLADEGRTNLYDPGGPLAKYDQAYGTISVDVEKTYGGYMYRHYYAESPLDESDAESTVHYDFNEDGWIVPDTPAGFWNDVYLLLGGGVHLPSGATSVHCSTRGYPQLV